MQWRTAFSHPLFEVFFLVTFQRLLHRMWPLQIGCRFHLLSLSYWTNNQPPYVPLFHSCYIFLWSRVSVIPVFFHLLLFPWQHDDLWPYLPHLLYLPLKNLLLCCFFYPYFSARTLSSVSFFSCFLFSSQLYSTELTDFFLEALVCHLQDVDIKRDSHRFISFRQDIKNICLDFIFTFLLFSLILLSFKLN